jgi:hypothetical protein
LRYGVWLGEDFGYAIGSHTHGTFLGWEGGGLLGYGAAGGPALLAGVGGRVADVGVAQEALDLRLALAAFCPAQAPARFCFWQTIYVQGGPLFELGHTGWDLQAGTDLTFLSLFVGTYREPSVAGISRQTFVTFGVRMALEAFLLEDVREAFGTAPSTQPTTNEFVGALIPSGTLSSGGWFGLEGAYLGPHPSSPTMGVEVGGILGAEPSSAYGLAYGLGVRAALAHSGDQASLVARVALVRRNVQRPVLQQTLYLQAGPLLAHGAIGLDTQLGLEGVFAYYVGLIRTGAATGHPAQTFFTAGVRFF